MESRRRVASAEKLLEVAATLLDADVALLLDGEGTEVNAAGMFPPAAASNREADFTRMIVDSGILSGQLIEGQGLAMPCDAPGPKETLIASGGRQRGLVPYRRIVLLRLTEREQRWNSYHTWAAAYLLEEHELKRAESLAREATRSVEIHRATARTYQKAVSREVLREESWDAFTERVGVSGGGSLDFMVQQAAVWTAYRLREKAANLPFPRTPSDDAEDERTALSRVRRELGSRALPEASRPWLDFMDWSVPAVPRAGAAASVLPPDTVLSPGLLEERENLRLLALTLEHAWRLVRDGATTSGIEMPRLVEGVNRLLDVSTVLAAACLKGEEQRVDASVSGAAHTTTTDRRCATPLGRNELRLYFVILLGQSTDLRDRYLGGGRTDGPRVADHARRGFIRSLARFLLAIVAQVEPRLGIDARPAPVSGGELLDSLLLLVDRYAHIGLGVDEALEIQRLLAHGLTAEVSQHLQRPRYRDHLIHVLDVFLLGHVLLDTELCWFGGRRETLEAHMSRLVSPQGGTAHWHREWAVASLLHDIGYQAWNDCQENPRANEGGFFGLRREGVPSWLTPRPSESADRGMEAPTALERFVKDLIAQLTLPRQESPGSQPVLDPAWLPSDATEKPRDHGILSALRVAQLLLHAGSAGLPGRNSLDSSRLAGCAHALHAIAHHNRFNHKVSFASHPLACLLRLCDELQEWGRRRVNIEQMVKGLYITVEGEGPDGIRLFESLAGMSTSLRFEVAGKREDRPASVRVTTDGDSPVLAFRLDYRNPVEASFDPVYTLLSKAYNLQALDLRHDRGETRRLRIQVELAFPIPLEYGRLTEYDAYGMFAETVHGLPVLHESRSADAALAGLSHLENSEHGRDRFAIVILGEAGSARTGWLPLDPAGLLEGFIDFKKALLSNPDSSRAARDS
jgi:hypothetical protein